jgi:hypothetical protein
LSPSQLQVLQEHQAALLALQQKAQEQLKEARAAQVSVVMIRCPVVSAEGTCTAVVLETSFERVALRQFSFI